ncbi:MAG: hypothetical protein EWM72_01017 [Nitrospira sp.]|nr:MAG: hypothetical protein EWM72_01017 [Nitrospira sp.]
MLDELPIESMAGLFELAGMKEDDHRGEFCAEPALILRSERRAAYGLDPKDIDDLFAVQAWAAFRAGAWAAGPGGASGSGCGPFDERIDLAFLNIQSGGREQAADRGEL